MKKHSFSVEFAERFGIVEALLLDYFFFWINNSQKKKEKDKYHDGRYWVYGSVRKIAEAHPYLSFSKVHRALKKLEEAGAIKTDAFNKMRWDKTTWYTLTDEILDLFQNATGCFKMKQGCFKMKQQYLFKPLFKPLFKRMMGKTRASNPVCPARLTRNTVSGGRTDGPSTRKRWSATKRTWARLQHLCWQSWFNR